VDTNPQLLHSLTSTSPIQSTKIESTLTQSKEKADFVIIVSEGRGDRLSIVLILAVREPLNLSGNLMERSAVGTAFRKRNGESKENGTRTIGLPAQWILI
jgi:hypothetical protein